MFGVKENKMLTIGPIDITHIKLGNEQLELFEQMEKTNEHMFITGKAGTGKSVLLQYFRKNSTKRIVVCAPTGVAAINIGGATIHSLFRLPIGFIDVQSTSTNSLRVSKKTQELLREVDCVVIDEISMVRADVLDGIDYVLRYAKGKKEAFGGTQIIMFGDLYQLQPVVADKSLHEYFLENHGGFYFFNAHVWDNTHFLLYELEHIYRQKDDKFKEILNAVRCGDAEAETLNELNKRVEHDYPENGVIALVPTNAQVEGINRYKLQTLPGQIKEYKAEVEGDISESYFPTDDVLRLKRKAQVIMVKNDREKRWVNGSIGSIIDLKDDCIKVKIGDDIYEVGRETWPKISYVYNRDTRRPEEEITGTFTQFPVKLSWAMTIHKSQGQTYDRVMIDFGTGAFTHGQTYVALSRARTLEGIYLRKPVEKKDIIVDPVIVEFMKREDL